MPDFTRETDTNFNESKRKNTQSKWLILPLAAEQIFFHAYKLQYCHNISMSEFIKQSSILTRTEYNLLHMNIIFKDLS